MFGRIIASITLVVMVFIFPLQYIMEERDMTESSYIESKTTEFVDHVTESGQITVKDYEQFQNSLRCCHKNPSIELKHVHPIVSITSVEKASDKSELSDIHSHNTGTLLDYFGHSHTKDCYGGRRCKCSDIVIQYSYSYTTLTKTSLYTIRCKECGALLYRLIDSTNVDAGRTNILYDYGYDGDSTTYQSMHSYSSNNFVVEFEINEVSNGVYNENFYRAFWQTIWNFFQGALTNTINSSWNAFLDIMVSYGYKMTQDEWLVRDSCGMLNSMEVCVCNQVIKSIVPLEPSQTVNQGDIINAKIKVTYLDGSEEEVFGTTEYTTDIVGDNQVAEIYYYGYADADAVIYEERTKFQCESIVHVKSNRMLTRIEPKLSSTTITKYLELPIESVKLYFDDGSIETVIEGWSITGYDKNTAGIQQIKISYTKDNNTCSTVFVITVTNLKKICPICESVYFFNDNDFDEGCPVCASTLYQIKSNIDSICLVYGEDLVLDIYGIYRNGNISKIENWVSNFKKFTIGSQLVTVSYGGCTTTVLVEVLLTNVCSICGYEMIAEVENPVCPICSTQVVKIEIIQFDSKVMYGEELSLVIKAYYRDGHTINVTEYQSNFNPFILGVQTITIVYHQVSASIQVEVIRSQQLVLCPVCSQVYDKNLYPNGCPFCSTEIDSIDAILSMGGTTVFCGSDLELQVIVYYKDGHREIKYNGYTIEYYKKEQLGSQKVKVWYKGKSCFLQIEVVGVKIRRVCENGHIYVLNLDGSDGGCPYCNETPKKTVIEYCTITYHDELLSTLYEKGLYELAKNDYIIVIVHDQRQLSNNFFWSIFHMELLYGNPTYRYGGEIIT